MNQPNASDLSNTKEVKLPGRDWILLPMISLLTICLTAVSTELIARRIFPNRETGKHSCQVTNDRSTGVRGIPNTACWGGLPEGEPVEYIFNSCGHRAGMECRPKSQATYRIVMVGSSLGMGLGVPEEQTFGALLPKELSRRTGNKVELYNESCTWEVPHIVDMRFNEVLVAKPDMILWVITSWDIENASLVLPDDYSSQVVEKNPSAPNEPAGVAARFWHRINSVFDARSLRDAIRDRSNQAQTIILLRHYLWQSQSLYMQDSLRGLGANYLMAEPSAQWQSHLHQFDSYAAEIESKARAEGVPLVAVLIPERPHAAMISTREWPAGFDPYKMDNELRTIVVNHGGTYIDILPDYRNIPNPAQGYLPVDGHPNAEGHAMISRMLAEELTNGAIPALRVTAQPQVVQESGR